MTEHELLRQTLAAAGADKTAIRHAAVRRGAVLAARQLKGDPSMQTRKTLPAAVAAGALCLCALGAAAAGFFLTPKEVADELGYAALSAAFAGPDAVAVNETKTDGDYTVTLLGLTKGKNLSDFEHDGAAAESTYAVTAIRRTDGEPVTLDEQFLVGPLISGEDPATCNPFMMNGGYAAAVRNGVLYCLSECDTVYPFADRTVYLMAQEGMLPDFTAYLYDAGTGAITANPDTAGLNVLFTLPLDAACADPARAQALLDEWRGTGPAEPVPELPPEQQTFEDAMDDYSTLSVEELRALGTVERTETVPRTVENGVDGWRFGNADDPDSEPYFLQPVMFETFGESHVGGLTAGGGDGGAQYRAYIYTHNADDTATLEKLILPAR